MLRTYTLPVCCILGRWKPAVGEAATSEVEHFLLDLNPEEVVCIILIEEMIFPRSTGAESSYSSFLGVSTGKDGEGHQKCFYFLSSGFALHP